MSSFTFKQFHINQQHCAMKVGTDGILLGAWADVENCQKILDMGTGTGLIALMLAQRTENSQIHAVELDPNAAQQAQENIQQSPWPERVFLHEQSILDFTQQTSLKFDLIVANPPYFDQGVACKNEGRELARYTKQSHEEWLNWAASCLTPNGKISFVLPYDAAKNLINSTALYCIKQTEIITKLGKVPQRMLVTFSSKPQDCLQDSLVIYDENNQYTPEFIALTKAFYLKF